MAGAGIFPDFFRRAARAIRILVRDDFFAFVGGIHSGFRGAPMGGLFGGFILGSANALLNTVERKEYLLWSAKGPGYANLELTGRLRGLVRHLMRSMVRSGVVAFLLYGSLLGFVALQEALALAL